MSTKHFCDECGVECQPVSVPHEIVLQKSGARVRVGLSPKPPNLRDSEERSVPDICPQCFLDGVDELREDVAMWVDSILCGEVQDGTE